MTSISEIISSLKELANRLSDKIELEVNAAFLAPTLNIDVVGSVFETVAFEAREILLSQWFEEYLPERKIDFQDVASRVPVVFNLMSPQEATARAAWTQNIPQASWVSELLTPSLPKLNPDNPDLPAFLHFYGYKGGQARSTVLGLLSKALADDGYRVLLVDADLEAPSLDMLLGASADLASQTMLGLCGWSEGLHPLKGVYSGTGGGRVDLIPARPRAENFDLDFALLVATTPLDSRIFQRAANALKDSLSKAPKEYDVVMVDHRTGIAASVIPLLHNLPGSAVVFARTDMNTANVPSELRQVVRAIFSNTGATPGAFVSFSLDANKNAEATEEGAEARFRELMLSELLAALESRYPNFTDSTTDLSLNWIEWYLDRALLLPHLPDVGKLQSDNVRSLTLLREALQLPLTRRVDSSTLPLASTKSSLTLTSSLSGAKDFGQFIHIPDLDKLFMPGNPFTYILGRKGTGKTRLLREIRSRNLGDPLLVANDETDTLALRSQSVEAGAWIEKCENNAATFWWSLLRIALTRPSKTESLDKIIAEHIEKNSDPVALANRIEIKKLIISQKEPRTFLVDGLETLVPAARIKEFVSALMELMVTMQNDVQLSTMLVIRAFIREDLVSDSVQNIEQQTEGRSLRLKWSAAAILNFALSRLPALPWISNQFKDVCDEINLVADKVARSALSELECIAMMLKIFPERVRRNNLSTATFLRLYFSDVGGDDTAKGTFYPRLYLSFLQKLDALAGTSSKALDDQGRLDSSLLNRAYDEASNEFINETKQELTHLLALVYESDAAPEDTSDAAKVTKFIAEFSGLSTPFLLEDVISKLHAKTRFTEKSIRESLHRMKSIRMFEDRPGYGGWWRVGQLYKMGLAMKYARS